MTWRISASRPITGSILPSRARCVRLVVYWSSAGVFAGAPGAASDAAAIARVISRARPLRVAALDFARARGQLVEIVLQVGRRELARTAATRAAPAAPGPGSVSSASSRCPADPADLRIERGDQPGMLEQRRQVRENTGVRVLPVLKRCNLALQIRAATQCASMPARAQHQRDVAGRFVQQREQQMLEVDLVVTARKTVFAASKAACRQVGFSLAIRVLRDVLMSCDPGPGSVVIVSESRAIRSGHPRGHGRLLACTETRPSRGVRPLLNEARSDAPRGAAPATPRIRA